MSSVGRNSQSIVRIGDRGVHAGLNGFRSNRLEPASLFSHVRMGHGSLLLLLTLLSILLFLVTSFVTDANIFNSYDASVLITFAFNGLIGIIFLVKSIVEKPFSLVQVHWIFFVTMFVVAPFSQYIYDYAPWGYYLADSDYFNTNILLILWGLIFAAASNLKPRGSSDSNTKVISYNSFFASLPKVSLRAALIVFAIAVCATVAVVALVGFSNLFSRDDFSTDLNKTAGLLFDKGIRPLPVFAFVVILVRVRQQKRMSPLLILCFLLVLLADFPAAMARYNMACLYGGMALLLVRPLFERKGLFPLVFLIAFLVLFPAANAYRWDTFELSMFFDAIQEALRNLPQGFCAVDYDAYSILARTIQYTESFGVENGLQLLGVLLFFVPRAMWPAKPDGSGNLVCAAQGQQQLNVSCPLPAEGFINYGLMGLLVFAVVLGVLCLNLDMWFQRSQSVLRIFYPFLGFLLFFILRGDLLSSFAFTVGYCVAFCVIAVLAFGISRRTVQKRREIYHG